MSVQFNAANLGYYKAIKSTVPTLLLDNWIIGCHFRITGVPLEDRTIFSLGRDDEPGRIKAFLDHETNRFTVNVGYYTTYFASYNNYVGEDWAYVSIHKHSNGVTVVLDRLGGTDHTEERYIDIEPYQWYEVIDPHNMDLFVGTAHDGTKLHSQLQGDIQDLFVGQSESPLTDMQQRLLSYGSLDPRYIVEVDFLVPFETADATVYDIVNEVPFYKVGDVTTGDSAEWVNTEGTLDLTLDLLPIQDVVSKFTPKDASIARFPSGDEWTVSLIFKLPPEEERGDKSTIFEIGNDGDGGINKKSLRLVFYSEIESLVLEATLDDWDNGYITEGRYPSNGTYHLDDWLFVVIANEAGHKPVVEFYTAGEVPHFLYRFTYPYGYILPASSGISLGSSARDNNPSGYQANLYQFWAVNEYIGPAEWPKLASGESYITDLVDEENIVNYWQLGTQNEVELDFITSEWLLRSGTWEAYDLPFPAQVKNEIRGDLPVLGGDWSAIAYNDHKIDGTFPTFEGDFDAVEYQQPGMVGVWPSLVGDFVGSYGNATSDIDGTLPAITGYFLGAEVDKLIGTFPAILGVVAAVTLTTNRLSLDISGIELSLWGANQGFVQYLNAEASDNMYAVSLGKAIRESLATSSVTTCTYIGTVAWLDSLSVKANALLAQNAVWADSLTATATAEALVHFNEVLAEAAKLVDSLVTSRVSIEHLSTVLRTFEGLAVGYLELLQEVLLVGQTEAVTATLYELLTSSLTPTAIQTQFRGLEAILSESLSPSVAWQVLQSISTSITESVSAQFYIDLEGEEYLATVLNTETDALWKYNNFGFNSFSGSLAAKDDGIYSLDGSDDAGADINSCFDTGYSNLGSSGLKRLGDGGIYLGLANDGAVRIKVTTSRNGVVEDDWYEETRTMPAYDTARIGIHDGLSSNYWKFHIANYEGSSVNLDTLHLYPVILTRNIR